MLTEVVLIVNQFKYMALLKLSVGLKGKDDYYLFVLTSVLMEHKLFLCSLPSIQSIKKSSKTFFII